MKKLNNKELLELLENDIYAFNEYRRKYQDQIIDFSDMCIRIKYDSFAINLKNIKMNNSTIYIGVYSDDRFAECYDVYEFNSCDLSGSLLRISRKAQVNFKDCNLSHSRINSLSYSFNCDVLCFINCNMKEMCFSGFQLTGIKFDYSDVNEVNFYGAKIENCSFFNVKNLDKVNITDKQLSLNYYQRYNLNTNNSN